MENIEKDKFSKCKFSFAEPCLNNGEVSVKYHCLKTDKQLENKSICEKCEKFISAFIEYPIQVSNINTKSFDTDGGLYKNKVGSMVSIRPCAEEYKNKTFLGVLLGDFPIAPWVTYNNQSKQLTVSAHYNPAIFVPELKKIIFGNESWWCIIENEKQFKEITNDMIDNTWYVQALKELTKPKEKNENNIGEENG